MKNVLLEEILEIMEAKAIALLRDKEPDGGYFFAFSGGKDSIVVDAIIKKSRVKYEKYFNRTSVDPWELLQFIKEHHPDTIHLKPDVTMFQLIIKKKMLPTRIIKFCCEHLKHYSGKGRCVVTGIRSEESAKRSERGIIQGDIYDEGKSYVHPIFFWNELHVWSYIEINKIPYCSLYDDYHRRIGCVGCPCQGFEGMKEDFKRYPKIRKAYLWSISKLMDMGVFADYDTPEDVLYWWMMGESKQHALHRISIEKESTNEVNVRLGVQ